jgi:hypothetical protein
VPHNHRKQKTKTLGGSKLETTTTVILSAIKSSQVKKKYKSLLGLFPTFLYQRIQKAGSRKRSRSLHFFNVLPRDLLSERREEGQVDWNRFQNHASHSSIHRSPHGIDRDVQRCTTPGQPCLRCSAGITTAPSTIAILTMIDGGCKVSEES